MKVSDIAESDLRQANTLFKLLKTGEFKTQLPEAFGAVQWVEGVLKAMAEAWNAQSAKVTPIKPKSVKTTLKPSKKK